MNADPKAAPPTRGDRVGSFIGWAFLISIAIHLVLLPFVKLHETAQQKEKVDVVAVTHKTAVHTPPPTPPPTPTPPPPTPPPKATPPPVKQTAPPPVAKLVVKPPKTTSVSKTGPTERKVDANVKENQNGVPSGTAPSAPAAPAAPAATGAPAPPAPTPVPTPVATPKPACAVPNKDASIKGSAVEAEYPDIARQSGAVGTAMVKVTLSAGGSVTDASINKSAGNPALDQAAIAAAKATSYSPDIVNCVPTAGSYLFQVDFTGQ